MVFKELYEFYEANYKTLPKYKSIKSERMFDFKAEWLDIIRSYAAIEEREKQGCYIIHFSNDVGFTYYPSKDRVQIHGKSAKEAWRDKGLMYILNYIEQKKHP